MLAVGEGWLRGDLGILGLVCARVGVPDAGDDIVLSFTYDAKRCGMLCIEL